jgi:ferredoxin
MRVHVNPEHCQGHGRCAVIAAEVFEIDDLGYASVLTAFQAVPAHLREQVLLAVKSCPEGAITMDSTNQGDCAGGHVGPN